MSQSLTTNFDLESRRKDLGAFYTNREIAQFLVQWAVRDSNDKVLDPSFGGGVFLKAAAEKILECGGISAKQIYGIEIDKGVHADTSRNCLWNNPQEELRYGYASANR